MRQSTQSVERAIARIASRQKGLITWRQLLAAGLGRASVARRLRDGRLHRVFKGVYLVGHEVMAPWARELAATLSYGSDALLSHPSGIALWQLLPRVPDTVHVTVTGRHSGSQPGIVVHRSKPLHPADRTRLRQIAVTTPARALLDFAETRPDGRDLQRAWSEAQARKLITPQQIERLLERSHGRRGAKPIAGLLHRAMTQRSDSDLEELLLTLIRQARLPEPEMQVTLLGRYRVDFLFREHNTIAEADGGGWHLSQQRRDKDNRRDSDLRAAGFTVERFTDHELTYEPLAAMTRLTRAIYA